MYFSFSNTFFIFRNFPIMTLFLCIFSKTIKKTKLSTMTTYKKSIINKEVKRKF